MNDTDYECSNATMPPGVKAISWTPANDTKLFLTILKVHDVKIDAGKVAEAFGTCIECSCCLCMMKLIFTLRVASSLNLLITPSIYLTNIELLIR